MLICQKNTLLLYQFDMLNESLHDFAGFSLQPKMPDFTAAFLKHCNGCFENCKNSCNF